MNFFIKLYILSMQKFIDMETTMRYFDLLTEDKVKELDTLLRDFKRNVKDQKQYLIVISRKNHIIGDLIARFISDKENINKPNLSLKDISSVIRVSEDNIVNHINYLCSKNITLAPLFFCNKNLTEEIRARNSDILKERLNNPHSRRMLFKNNSEKKKELFELAKEIGIETLSYKFNTSMCVIYSTLREEKKGGFWENENIRTNAPFFINDVKLNDFSLEELFYIIDNREKSIEEIAKKMHTTTKNIKKIYELVDAISLKHSKEHIKNLISSEEHFSDVDNMIKEIKNVKKDENRKDLEMYTIDKLFTLAEKEKIKDFFIRNFENPVMNTIALIKNNEDVVSVFKDRIPHTGRLIDEGKDYIKIAANTAEGIKITEFNKNEIDFIHYLKIGEVDEEILE